MEIERKEGISEIEILVASRITDGTEEVIRLERGSLASSEFDQLGQGKLASTG
jgi:hypothetical protein